MSIMRRLRIHTDAIIWNQALYTKDETGEWLVRHWTDDLHIKSS